MPGRLDKVSRMRDIRITNLTAAYKQVGDWWAASIAEIPGVHTQGKTFEEARENLHDASQMVIEVNRELAERENEATRREEFVVA